MKASIHPPYFADSLITCACGNTFKIGSTKDAIRVEICSKCHPFYTGAARFADVKGKVKSFQEKMELAKVKAPELAKKKAKKAGIIAQKEQKSLKEMLMGA